jgi:hypothetical protein
MANNPVAPVSVGSVSSPTIKKVEFVSSETVKLIHPDEDVSLVSAYFFLLRVYQIGET